MKTLERYQWRRSSIFIVKGNTHMTSILRGSGERGGGGKEKNEMLLDVGGGGLASILDVQSLFFLLKKIGFAP